MNQLSVIVPVYNSEKYLRKCIDSIRNQIYQDMQIILVDDGSSDNSGEICDEYLELDNRIYVIHQCNSGPAMARYKGVLASDSEYITFVDADDWIDPNTYFLFTEEMAKGIDLITFGKVDEKEGVGKTYIQSQYPYGEYNREDIEKKIWPTMMWDFETKRPGMTQALYDKIIKKEILLKAYDSFGDIPNIHNGEDPMILFPVMQWVNTMYISKEYPYHYRLHLNAVPTYVSNDDFFDKLYIWYKHLIDNTKLIPNIRKQIEYVYMYEQKARKRFYGDFVQNDDYFFPFSRIPVHSKIILYGAGIQGMTYYDQLRRSGYCEIVAWVDKNYLLYEKYGVKNTELLKNTYIKYDYVVIAISSEVIRNEVIAILCGFGIKKEKII